MHWGISTIIALKASGRDCTNNNELLHKIGVLQRYAMQLFVFTSELLQAIRWRSKYNGCTQRIWKQSWGFEPKVEGSSPSKTFFYFLLSQRSRNFSRFTCLQKEACSDVLCTSKATSLSKMARLVLRCSDDAGAIIENVYKFCMEEMKSGMKLSLNCVWYRLQHSLALADLPLRKLCKRSRRHMTSSSLGPVVNILAIFSYANILKK